MFALEDIVKVVKGKILKGKIPFEKIAGVSIDSRTLRPGDLFIAVAGQRFDGHDFIPQAVNRGACAVIVSKEIAIQTNLPVIGVENTMKALGQIAWLYRRQFSIPVIAITGSAGKTTTKEMLAAILEGSYRVLKNIKTENNQIGVSLTLLRLTKDHEVVILELGTNHPGEIRWLTEIAKPTIAVLTNVGASHLEGLKSPEGVFKEKFDLVRFMDPSGVVIFNKDDSYLKTIEKKRISPKKISYSIKASSDVKISALKTSPGEIQFAVEGNNFSIKTMAAHNAYNSLAAISCARLLKVKYEVIKKGLASFENCQGRQEIKDVAGVRIINDSYNSNPISLKSAIETLDLFKTNGRKILVCADMLELGSQSKLWHKRMGKIISETTIHVVLTLGSQTVYLSEQINKNDKMFSIHCQSLEEICQHLKRLCKSGDVVLIKGSRGMKMEQAVEFLEHNFNIN